MFSVVSQIIHVLSIKHFILKRDSFHYSVNIYFSLTICLFIVIVVCRGYSSKKIDTYYIVLAYGVCSYICEIGSDLHSMN